SGLGVLKPTVGPVTVRLQTAGKRPVFPQGSKEIPGDIEPGIALEIDFLDRVSVAFETIKYARVQRRLFGHRPESGGYQDLHPQRFAASQPFLLRFVLGHRIGHVDVPNYGRARVLECSRLLLPGDEGRHGQSYREELQS